MPHEPAAVEDHDPVGDLLHLVELVAGHEHGAALVGEVAQEAAQPADAVRVQAVGRLVQDEHARVAEQRGGQRRGAAACPSE